MRLLILPCSALLLLLTLGGCVEGGGYYAPSYGYGGYGYAPYGGYAYRPYGHGYRAWDPPRHQHHSHARSPFQHRPIWKKW
ncbi:MAG: hypothetical protein INF84_01205 [Roseomonas sp.]|jgi:hypothetical protein|nr:hypothetical protein [Roseomonas sp.]